MSKDGLLGRLETLLSKNGQKGIQRRQFVYLMTLFPTEF